MLKSMTGFGKATCELGDKRLNIEIKSLNSKQMDIMLRIPQHYKEKELAIRNSIAKQLIRGKAEANIWFDGDGEKNVSINTSIVKKYYEQLNALSISLGSNTKNNDLLQMIMRLPDVLESERAEISEQEWEAVQSTLQEAISQLNEFRLQEGQSLANDMKERIHAIQACSVAILDFESERDTNVRTKLENSLAKLAPDVTIDKERLEQEIIYYLDKYDINEEKVRLANHCSYFLETLDIEGAIGKKLGFISQEIGREINTLGSKANHDQIQRLVVQMKEELEKIKEQVLNSL